MNKLLACIIPFVLLTGCQTAPTGRIRYNPSTHSFAIASPKDVEIRDVQITIDGEKAKITIGSFQSKNNVAVVEAIAGVNREITAAVNTRLEQAIRAQTGAGGR